MLQRMILNESIKLFDEINELQEDKQIIDLELNKKLEQLESLFNLYLELEA